MRSKKIQAIAWNEGVPLEFLQEANKAISSPSERPMIKAHLEDNLNFDTENEVKFNIPDT